MAHLIDTLEDKLRYELGSKCFEIEVLKWRLMEAEKREADLKQEIERMSREMSA